MVPLLTRPATFSPFDSLMLGNCTRRGIVNQRHRPDPILALAEHLNAGLVLGMVGLQVQQTGNHLQVLLTR